MNIRGPTLVEQPIRESYTLTGGFKTTRTYKGTQAEIEALYATYIANGSSADIEEGAFWTLTVDIQGEDPEYTWEVLSEAQSVDVLMTDLFVGLTANERLAIRDFDNFEGDLTSWPTGISTSLAKKAFLLKLRGLDQVTLLIPVMRTAYTVNADFQIPTSTTNIDVVHSTSTMINIEQIPPRLWGTLEASSTYTVSDTIGGDTIIMTYSKGWLKGTPTVTYTGKGKINVGQAYRFASYSNDVYGSMI